MPSRARLRGAMSCFMSRASPPPSTKRCISEPTVMGRARVAAPERGGAGRFVYVSSIAAAGPAPRGRALTGSETPAPVTAYGRSKLAGESAVRECKLPWTIVRPPMVYGPRDREVLKVFQLARLGL